MCTGQKRGIRTGYCSPLFNWFTYFNSQGRCLDSEWPNEQTFSFSLALVRPPRRIFYLAELIGQKKGRRPKSRRWDVRIFSESKEELFKSPRRWIRLNHSATFKYFFQRFKGFAIKFAPHVAEEFRAPAKFSIRTHRNLASPGDALASGSLKKIIIIIAAADVIRYPRLSLLSGQTQRYQKPSPPKKLITFFTTAATKSRMNFYPPLVISWVSLVFYFPATPLLAKRMVFVGKMCTQSFKRRRPEGKSDGSRLHTSPLRSVRTFTTSLVPECDSLIFAVWPFHATHLLIRPFLLPPHTRSLARTHTHAASFKAFPLSPYNPSNLRATQ